MGTEFAHGVEGGAAVVIGLSGEDAVLEVGIDGAAAVGKEDIQLGNGKVTVKGIVVGAVFGAEADEGFEVSDVFGVACCGSGRHN